MTESRSRQQAPASPHPHTRRGHDLAEYQRYFQGNGVPYNRKGITDPKAYAAFEYQSYIQRSKTRPTMKAYTYEEMKQVHQHLFGGVWSWAGQTRTYPTGREGSVFAKPEFIESFADEQCRKLQAEDHLKGLNKDAFAQRAAHYVNELNACHPFVEGNGRVIRAFLEDLAKNAGHRLHLQRTNRAQWYEASRQGFQGNNEPMSEIIRHAIRDRPREKLRTRSRSRNRNKGRSRGR